MNTMKKQALLDVIKFIGISIAGGIGGAVLINLVPLEYIGIGVCIIGIGFALKTMYNIRVEYYERQAKYQEIYKDLKIEQTNTTPIK